MAFVHTPKRRKVSLGTTIEAALSHKSIKDVYAEKKVLEKNVHLTGAERNLLVNDPRLKVQKRGGGWAKVTYMDTRVGSPVTFSIRMSKIEGVMYKQPTAWFHPAEAVYSQWINYTARGAKYSARRQVEGMLKVAIKKGDSEMVDKLTYILSLNDDKVEQFRKDWLDSHTNEEIEDWYDYEEEEEWV